MYRTEECVLPTGTCRCSKISTGTCVESLQYMYVLWTVTGVDWNMHSINIHSWNNSKQAQAADVLPVPSPGTGTTGRSTGSYTRTM